MAFFDMNKPQNPENNDEKITDSADELVRFKENERHDYKNIKRKVIIPPIYLAFWHFYEGLALVKLDLKRVI
ncbi:WG repeat-containing protein [Dapis sp. BLCC M229]|uniref:WG repeat-containing protein n=1 Tax=Dapis sp. BLCC M229 TaxID=3400188 RepID=UPI003CEFE3F4